MGLEPFEVENLGFFPGFSGNAGNYGNSRNPGNEIGFTKEWFVLKITSKLLEDPYIGHHLLK